jgi:hypothetical protein
MRKTLLIALLLIPFLGISQTKKPVDGFLGIKFGSSKEDVIAALKARGGVLSDGATDSKIRFTNIKLGPRQSEALRIYFVDNKMCQGSFYFTSEHDSEVIPNYKALVNDISDVYGKGNSISDFKPPYKEGDGDEIQAIKAGEATIYTDFKSDNNLLQVKIVSTKDYDLFIVASYYDNTLVAEAQAKEKEKAKSDY